MKRQEAQRNSVAERRGWEQRRARRAVDSASELDSAVGTTGEPASYWRSQASWKRGDLQHSDSMAKGGCGRSVRWLEIECLRKWLRETRETPARTETAFMPTGTRGGQRAGCWGVRASIRAQATLPESERTRLVAARRRVTTAGAKGRREMEAK